VESVYGGKHNGGTLNSLLSTGEFKYVELLSIDYDTYESFIKDFPGGASGIKGRLLNNKTGSIITFVVRPPKGTPIETFVANAKKSGYDAGPVASGKRTTKDGKVLTWKSAN
jgi:hypothetical protein